MSARTPSLLFLSLIFLLSHAVANEKPNVLFIAIDDLNDWVGFMGGHPQAKTPHMDPHSTWL